MARILLVEDNEMNRDMLSRRLTRKGFEVEIATTGVESVETARLLCNSLDLILMDVSLPEMDGLEATRRLKAPDSECGKIPVIALTAHAMASDRKKALEAGCDDFATKPVDFPKLLEQIEGLI